LSVPFVLRYVGGKRYDLAKKYNTSLIVSGCGLVVRRGSEPALNNFGKNVPNTDDEEEIFPWQPVKRWSSSLAADDHKSPRVCIFTLLHLYDPWQMFYYYRLFMIVFDKFRL